jgi:hypothetical protein
VVLGRAARGSVLSGTGSLEAAPRSGPGLRGRSPTLFQSARQLGIGEARFCGEDPLVVPERFAGGVQVAPRHANAGPEAPFVGEADQVFEPHNLTLELLDARDNLGEETTARGGVQLQRLHLRTHVAARRDEGIRTSCVAALVGKDGDQPRAHPWTSSKPFVPVKRRPRSKRARSSTERLRRIGARRSTMKHRASWGGARAVQDDATSVSDS